MGHTGALGQIFRRGHGFHGQARGRLTRRVRYESRTDGILRLRYRDSQEKPELLNPDQVYKISVDLWATSNVFRRGHIIRLEVSSSNFPRFDRNLNTGADQATSRQFVSATNTILHDAEHPSALLVPVIPARAATPR
ncbi:MAG: hypothetical protein DMG42_29440 [Acidobacteria bacterium]|nr:MAG: hypothetical protein DMG42_29440 [Acidobacteriota bacterium]